MVALEKPHPYLSVPRILDHKIKGAFSSVAVTIGNFTASEKSDNIRTHLTLVICVIFYNWVGQT